MRGTVAKLIRKQAYSDGHHPGSVLYYRDIKGTITADTVRQLYQRLKKQHKRAGTLLRQQ